MDVKEIHRMKTDSKKIWAEWDCEDFLRIGDWTVTKI